MYLMEELVLEAIHRQAKKQLEENEKCGENRKKLYLAALTDLKKRVSDYADRSFAFFLLLEIMRKKSHMILEAETKAEITEILKPSIPQWNYGSFITGPYHVLEEEVIFWSLASLEAPLNEDGVKRYEEVFSILLPESAEEIFKT